MNKLDKYIQKFTIKNKSLYLAKIIKYIILQNGGTRPKLSLNNLDSILLYLKEAVKNNITTRQQYFIIAYGPPGSGKSNAFNKVVDLIIKNFEIGETSEQIKNTVINTGIDNIVYDTKFIDDYINILPEKYKGNIEHYKNQDTGFVLKDIYDKKIDELRKQDRTKSDITNIKEKINDFVKNSSSVYRGVRYRAHSSEMSELLIYLSIFLRKNIFFEIAGYYEDYMKQIFNVIRYSNYIPIFLYPFTPYSSLIYNRTIDRGIREGRFLNCDGEYGIKNIMKNMLDGYNVIKEHFKEKFKDKQYILLQYISIFDNEISELEHKYIIPTYLKSQLIMEFIIQKNNKDNQLITEHMQTEYYEEIMHNMKTECEIEKEFKLK